MSGVGLVVVVVLQVFRLLTVRREVLALRHTHSAWRDALAGQQRVVDPGVAVAAAGSRRGRSRQQRQLKVTLPRERLRGLGGRRRPSVGPSHARRVGNGRHEAITVLALAGIFFRAWRQGHGCRTCVFAQLVYRNREDTGQSLAGEVPGQTHRWSTRREPRRVHHERGTSAILVRVGDHCVIDRR